MPVILKRYPIFESKIILFETEQSLSRKAGIGSEFAGVFEGDKILVKLNEDYPDENRKYSVYFLDACTGLNSLSRFFGKLPNCWEIDYR